MNFTRTFIFAIAILSGSICHSQSYYEDDFFSIDDTYNSFESRVGRVININETEIGKSGRMQATLATAQDMMSLESLSALRIELKSNGASSYGYGEMIATIDQDEFDRFLESVERIHGLLNELKPESTQEYVYRSREGVTYGGSIEDGELKQYLLLSMYNDLSYVLLDEAQYQEFLSLLKIAKEMM